MPERKTEMAYADELNAIRSFGAPATSWAAPIATNADSVAYCHPNSTWDASRKTNAREALRSPDSSSGTGLNSAASAATANTTTPTTVSAVGGVAMIVATDPAITGTDATMTSVRYRSSRGGYIWDVVGGDSGATGDPWSYRSGITGG